MQVSFLKYWYCARYSQYLGSRPAQWDSDFNWVIFFLDRQIAKLKTSPNFPAMRYMLDMTSQMALRWFVSILFMILVVVNRLHVCWISPCVCWVSSVRASRRLDPSLSCATWMLSRIQNSSLTLTGTPPVHRYMYIDIQRNVIEFKVC